MNEKKQKISKCECCPYFAKNFIDEKNQNKWVCTRKGLVKKQYGSGNYYHEKTKVCLFDCREAVDSDSYLEEIKEVRDKIIERWLKANE